MSVVPVGTAFRAWLLVTQRPVLESGLIGSVHVCFHCCDKTLTRIILGRKGFIWITYPESQFIEENNVRNLEAEVLFTGLLVMAHSACFLKSTQNHQARYRPTHNGLGCLTPITN